MSSEQEPAGFNGGYNPDGTWRWHVFNPNASPLEKKQVELDCMTRLKSIQEERTAHWRGIAEQADAMPKDWSLAWSTPEGCWQVTGVNGWGSDDYTFGVIGSGSSPIAAIKSALSNSERTDEKISAVKCPYCGASLKEGDTFRCCPAVGAPTGVRMDE